MEVAASLSKVWALLIDAAAWPKWQPGIESVTCDGPLSSGAHFVWKSGGASIQSRVELFEPGRRLGWTGTSLTTKAIHIWELHALPADRTLVVLKESMDGPLMAKIYPSEKLREADRRWLEALKQAAEKEQ